MTDNKQTDAKVPVTIMETAANIKDYYNLRTLWGIPAVQLILSLCLFRIASESIHSMYKKSYYDLLSTGYRPRSRRSRRWGWARPRRAGG